MWVADIAYVATAEGWLYVAGVLDLYSRKLVGWAAEDAMPTALVARAFSRAVTHRRPPAPDSCTTPTGAASMPAMLTANSYTPMESSRA